MISMNKYRSAMEKIMVSPQMEERILRNVLEENEPGADEIKQTCWKWIKPVGAIAACCVIALSVMVIYPSVINSDHGEPGIEIPNPIVNVKGIDELKKNVSFDLLVPTKLPTGYKIEYASVISGEMAQITYTSESNKIRYRTVKGDGDISGDYTSYEEFSIFKIGDAEVTLKGSKSLVKLATWTLNGCSYSLSFSAGVGKDVALSIIESIKKV